MRRLLRPRNWIALFAGIGAGLAVWMLPPLPDWRIATPEGSVLHALSPGGRHLVTWRLDTGRRLVQIQDCINPNRDPITVDIAIDSWWYTHFSPDGTTLVFVTTIGAGPLSDAKWFDLATGSHVKTQTVPVDVVFYSAQGDLYYFKQRGLYQFEGNAEVRQLPETIDGFKHDQRYGEFVIYSKDDPLSNEQRAFLVYDALLGKEVTRMTIPGNMTHVRAISRDGKVISVHGWAPGSGPWRIADQQVLADAAGFMQVSRDSPTHYFRGLSPSGELVVSYRPTERPDWLRKWWPLKEDDATFVITDWRTGVERAHFRDMVHLEFSPDNEHLAITRPGNIVEGYAWPLRPPWGLLIAATLGAAFGMWCIGWLWARWRARRSSTQMERGKDKDEVQHALAPLSDSITRVS